MNRIERIFWAALATWACLAIVPASIWYDAGDIRIDDIQRGEALELIYSGKARREFIGSYSVIVRNASSGSVVAEDRSGLFQYRTDTSRPVPLTIEWWAPGSETMRNLPAGSYVMETCWTVHSVFWGIVPGKTTCASSNIFKVTE